MIAPGMAARMADPASNGTKIVLSKLRRRGAGLRVTADPEAPRSWQSTKGIVNMPTRLDETVNSNASAVFPPTVCNVILKGIEIHLLESTVGGYSCSHAENAKPQVKDGMVASINMHSKHGPTWTAA